MPFVILFLSVLHIKAVHEKGSTEPLGISSKSPKKYIGLSPNFIIKDVSFIV